jgi:predicted amidohydrolase
MFHDVRVAALSFVPKKFDVAANADRLERMFREAAAGGAQLALAPEGILDGYVVNRIIEGSAPAARLREAAVSLRGAVVRRFRDLARELGLCLAFGLAERIGDDVYNAAVFIDQRGRLAGTYHKMQLAEGYHPSWWWNRLGRTSRAFDTPFGRCGFLICNDRWNADLARIPVLDGAQYLLIPSYGSRSRAQDRAVLGRARENGVPIVEANVGVTLIISKGEIVALSRKQTAITCGTIAIPAPPSPRHRDRQERAFLRWRAREMPLRYRERMKSLREQQEQQKTVHDEKGRLVRKGAEGKR